jgi:formate hydrogenlyase transcriptional activator
MDKNEKQKAEAMLQHATLLWTVGHLINDAASLDQLANAATDAMVQHLGCGVALVFQTGEKNLLLRSLSLRGSLFESNSPVTPFIRDCLCESAMREARPVYCRDTFCDGRCTLHEFKDTGLRSFTALPLKHGEQVIGVLGIGSVQAHDFEEDAAFLETLAAVVAAGLSNCLLRLHLTERAAQFEREIAERKTADQILRDSEERLRMIMQQVPGILWAVDRDLRFTSSTGKALKQLGLPENQVRGMTLAEYAGGGDPASQFIASHQSALRGESVNYEIEWSGRTFEVLLGPFRQSGDAIDGALGVALDITELRRNTQRLETLLQVTHCSASHLEPRALFSAVCACLRNIVQQDFAGLLVWDATRQLTEPVILDVSPESSDLNALIEIAEKHLHASLFPGHEIKVVLPADMQMNDFFSSLVQAGVRAICSIPLNTADGAQGILLLGSKSEDAFSAPTLDLLDKVAPQLALGLANARAYAQIKELQEKLAEEKIYLEQEIQTESRFDEIVGRSRALTAVLELVKQVAPTDANVLITGETGTGKELIARAVHQMSDRSHNSFIKLNCAAIPSGLLESELFGYERGAFTSASSRRIGRVELAHKGTLFLDEIGDLPLDLQPKLLRVLEDHELERLGSTKTIRVNTRLIAVTNRDLLADVADGLFRADLFFRLQVFPIKMPALRERRADIPLLVAHFVHKYATRMKKSIDRIPAKTMSILTRWTWPGNIRELENFIERSVILTEGPVLQAPLAELSTLPSDVYGTLQDATQTIQRDQIVRVLRETNGVISGAGGAAARLGVKRTTLQSMAQRLGIPLDRYRKVSTPEEI